MKKYSGVLIIVFFAVFTTGCKTTVKEKALIIPATGKPAEGDLVSFMGKPFFYQDVVFSDSINVREPYLAVATDGTVLIMRNRPYHPEPNPGHLRRSEDGGRGWSEIIEVPFGFLDSNFIPDENTGDIIVIRLWDSVDKLWRSSDHGKTWKEERFNLKPDEVMKWLEKAELKRRGTWNGGNTEPDTYFLHNNASESGITLRHGYHKGRLIVTGTFRPHAKEHPSDRKPQDYIYSCAVYSDDHGSTWQLSGLFPEGTTEEAALVELHDGRIYYNSRCGNGFYDKSLARELRPDESLRREAWSSDGGQTWENLRINEILPDGGGYSRGYGLKAGFVRLPVRNRDILIYSNTDTGGGKREKLTVWASFDGGETWPIKRLVYQGPAAYSSLGAGRPDTAGDGTIFLLFEGSPEHCYGAMQIARFNLSWILEGELTGNGEVPAWIKEK